jgi:hypothetical protein
MGLLDDLLHAPPCNPAGTAPLVELDRLHTAIRLRRRWQVLGAVIGPTVAVLFALALSAGPAAAAQVMLARTDSSANPDRLSGRDEALCGASAVARGAADALHVDPGTLRNRYTCVEVKENVVELRTHAASAADALRSATALAEAYRAVYVGQIDALTQAQVTDLQQRRADLQTRLEEVTAQLTTLTDPAQIQFQLTQQQSLAGQRNELDRRIGDLRSTAAAAMTGSKVVNDARLLPLRHHRTLAVAAVMGLILGWGVAWVASATAGVVRDRPVRRHDLAVALGAPVLMDVRRAPGGYDTAAAGAELAGLLAAHTAPVVMLQHGCAALARSLAEEAGRRCGQLPPTVGPLHPRGAWRSAVAGPAVVVLVIRAGSLRERALRLAAADLEHARLATIGVFLVDPDSRDETFGAVGRSRPRPAVVG